MNRRVAIVTGAGRRIGAATLAALAADGWSVVAVDRCSPDRRLPYPMASERDLDEAVAGAATRAGREDVARAVVADASDRAALAAVVEGAEAWGTSTPSSPTRARSPAASRPGNCPTRSSGR